MCYCPAFDVLSIALCACANTQTTIIFFVYNLSTSTMRTQFQCMQSLDQELNCHSLKEYAIFYIVDDKSAAVVAVASAHLNQNDLQGRGTRTEKICS